MMKQIKYILFFNGSPIDVTLPTFIEKVIAETRRQYESFKSTYKDEQEEIYNFLFQQYKQP